MSKLNQIIIGDTEVILQDYEIGQGKIIISDSYNGSYSTYWGSMGEQTTISDFIKRINPEYFAGRLCGNMYTFSAIKTARGVRRYLREEMKHDLPWYKFMPSQKELRNEIKKVETAGNEYEAISLISGFKDVFSIDSSYQEEKEFKEIIESVFSNEPHMFLENDFSSSYLFLMKLHKELKSKL